MGTMGKLIDSEQGVTALKTARDIRLVEEKYGNLLEHAPDAILIVNVTGHVVLVNAQTLRLFNYTRENLVGQPVEMLLPQRFRDSHPGHRDNFFAMPRCRAMGGAVLLCARHRSGEEFPVEISLGPLDTEAGKMVMCSVRDVGDLQKARNRADRTFRDLLESTPDAMVIVNQSGDIVLVNSQTVSLFGWEHEELLGRSVEVLVPMRFRGTDPGHRSVFFNDPTVHQLGMGIDLYGLRKDDSEFPVEIRVSPIQTEGGLLVANTIRDATERRRNEASARDGALAIDVARHHAEREQVLEESLREKEVLLKEIHHRVKNNLQVISSLLQLQAGYLESDETRRVFEESQGRIRSMALVHEKLYQSKDMANIDFGDYLRDLVTGLIGSYRATHAERVGIEIDAASVQLDVDRAIPCGLVVNELVTNSLKHAFPNGRVGRVRVRLSGGGAVPIKLTVQDDGVGWPDGFDPAHSASLGLKLVHILAKQLHAGLTLGNEDGIRCVLTISPANLNI